MNELDSWLSPVSRKSNPDTSREAESWINHNGSRQTHVQAVFDIVREMPGLTTGEIGEMSTFGQMETRKRLSDLKNTNMIRQGKPRVWTPSGRNQSTWWPVVEETQGRLLVELF